MGEIWRGSLDAAGEIWGRYGEIWRGSLDAAGVPPRISPHLPASPRITLQALELHGGPWAQWASSDRPEAEWPHSLPPSVTPFQRVLVVQARPPPRASPHLPISPRALRPDRLHLSISAPICPHLPTSPQAQI